MSTTDERSGDADGIASVKNVGMKLETLTVRKEGAVLLAEINAPPMNLLGPELVRDLVSLIQQAEAEATVHVLVFTSADPVLFHFPCRRDPDRQVPGGGGEADR